MNVNEYIYRWFYSILHPVKISGHSKCTECMSGCLIQVSVTDLIGCLIQVSVTDLIGCLIQVSVTDFNCLCYMYDKI